MRPPPYPPPYPPYPPARDEVTQPGLGETPREAALRVENVRLRRERNAARKERDAALLGTSAPGTSIAPDLTRKQKAARFGLTASGVTLLTALVGVLVPIIERNWPAYAGIIRGIQQNLGLQ
jgi:hypothetical protein